MWLVRDDVTTLCESEDSRTRSRRLCASNISFAIGYQKHRCFIQKEGMRILWIPTPADIVVFVVGPAQMLTCIPLSPTYRQCRQPGRVLNISTSYRIVYGAVYLLVTDWYSSASPLATPQHADRLHSRCTPTWKALIVG